MMMMTTTSTTMMIRVRVMMATTTTITTTMMMTTTTTRMELVDAFGVAIVNCSPLANGLRVTVQRPVLALAGGNAFYGWIVPGA